MKKLLLLTFVFCAALAMSSCSSAVVSNFNDLSMLRKGMDTAAVDRLFDSNTLRDKQTVSIPNSPYTVKFVFVLVQYIESSNSGMRSTMGPSTYTIYNPFALVFENGKLINWGFRYEFNMSENPEMRKVGSVVWQSTGKEGK